MSKEVTHEQEIEVRVDQGEVVIEPPEIHGVRGFEIRLTPARARSLAGSLISAAVGVSSAKKRPADIG